MSYKVMRDENWVMSDFFFFTQTAPKLSRKSGSYFESHMWDPSLMWEPSACVCVCIYIYI